MMRREFATDSSVTTTGLRAILVAGSLGSGAGLIADVIHDVVRLALGRVERRRHGTGHGRRTIVVERLNIDPTAAERRRDDAPGLAILCDGEADEFLAQASHPADERIVIEEPVPAWRQNLLPTAATDAESARLRSIDVAARGVAIASRRLPYTADLWRRSLARHVPKRYRESALAKFEAELAT
jgi:hypothetical protein